MDYLGIIKKSFQIIWKNKFLWIFGFFVASGSAGLGNLNFLENKNQKSLEETFWRGRDYVLTHWNMALPIIIAIISVATVIILLFIALRILFRGALIKGINQADENLAITFKESFRAGKPYFFKILGLDIIFLLVKVVILAAPLILLFSFIYKLFSGGQNSSFFVFLSIFSFLIFLIALIIFVPLGIIETYALCFLILKNKKIIESIKSGFLLFKRLWKQAMIMWLWLFLISIAIGFGTFLAIIVLIIPFVILGFGLFLIFNVLGIIIAVALGFLVLFVFSFVLRGAIASFLAASWVLTFKNLIAKSQETIQ